MAMSEGEAAAPSGAAGSLPLGGLRVVALEQAVAAPLCTRHLADLGAEVVKIERPGEGDFARGYDSTVLGMSSWFVWLNQGKRSITLDLKQEAARAVLHRLLARADVVVQNFAPGALDRLGLGVDQLRAAYPAMVVCSITGYGEDGPYRDRKAYDLLLQAEAGVLSVTGTPESPSKSGISIVDLSAGIYAFSAILAALYRRRGTGEGAAIRISLFDVITEWMSAHTLQARGGAVPPRAGARHFSIVPYGPYRVAAGREVVFAIQNEREWVRLCTDVLGHPEWATDERFKRNELRVANRAVLEPMIEEALAGVSVEEAEARLERAAIAFSRNNDVTEVLQHPQIFARDRLRSVATPFGQTDLLRAPFNIDGVVQPPAAVPDVGEHTVTLLQELGYAESEIADLQRGGAV